MIKQGSTVSFHYSLSIDNELIDSSEGKNPFSYTHGGGEIVPGLESELLGRKPGEKLTVTVAPEDGYGPHLPEAVRQIPSEAFADLDDLKVGDFVRGQMEDRDFAAQVAAIDGQSVTLDMNHPLAGKTLRFVIEIVGVK